MEKESEKKIADIEGFNFDRNLNSKYFFTIKKIF